LTTAIDLPRNCGVPQDSNYEIIQASGGSRPINGVRWNRFCPTTRIKTHYFENR
jgi:hypothetical protein